jgi:threonine dehydrogenase-like Zn-dependent dehydrogenase
MLGAVIHAPGDVRLRGLGRPEDPGAAIDGQELLLSHVALRGGPAPVRRYLPDLIDRVLTARIGPGKVLDLVLPLEQVAEGYKAMDARRAVKALLDP